MGISYIDQPPPPVEGFHMREILASFRGSFQNFLRATLSFLSFTWMWMTALTPSHQITAWSLADECSMSKRERNHWYSWYPCNRNTVTFLLLTLHFISVTFKSTRLCCLLPSPYYGNYPLKINLAYRSQICLWWLSRLWNSRPLLVWRYCSMSVRWWVCCISQ